MKKQNLNNQEIFIGGGMSFHSRLLSNKINPGTVKTIIIDPEGEYTKLAEMLGCEVITINPDSGTVINPFEIVDYNITREETLDNLKEFLFEHYRVANILNLQRLSISDIKEICERNNLSINDDELLNIIAACEKSIN